MAHPAARAKAEAALTPGSVPVTPPLPLGVMLLYGVGDVANAVKMVLFGLFTLYFYATVVGLSPRWVGIASAVGLVWDALIDPYIGHASDRMVSRRWGRRHPPMLLGALTMGVCFWAFFAPPAGLGPALLFLWLLVAGLAVRTATSLYGVPYYALGAELSPDYHERTKVTGLRSAWALVGTLCAAALPFLLFFPDPLDGTDPKMRYAGYPLMGLVFGGVMTTAGLVTWLGTLSRRHPPEAPGRTEASRGAAAFFRDMALALHNRSFRVLFVSFSLFFLGVVLNGVLSIHFLTHYVQIHAGAHLSAFQLAFYVGALAGVAVWTPLSKRTEKRRLYLLATLLTATVLCAAYFLFGPGHVFGVGNIVPLALGHALAGFFASIVWILPTSMIADVADEDACTSGQRREGTFFGIFFFGQQIAAGLALLLAGVLAEDFAGLIPGQAAQGPETVQRLAMLYSLLPAGLVLAAALLILRYTLTRERVEAFQCQLAEHSQANRPEGP